MSFSPVGGEQTPVDASRWPAPPPNPTLARDEVHVWAVPLDLPPLERTQLAATLSPDERARAARLHFARDRDRWVVGRGRLRQLLGRYLDRAPASLRFAYECACDEPDCGHPHRKPALADDRSLEFNVSHSGGLALIAVARDRRVGIDLEHCLPADEILPLAPTFCAPSELAALHAISSETQATALTSLWTCKEAYLKARGIGLILPPQEVEFALATLALPSLLRVSADPQEAARWTLIALPPLPGYGSALAIAGAAPTLRCWHWPPHAPE